jgi:hypothetical protein
MMHDRIRGQVFEIIDGRTFKIKVLEQRDSNEYGYDIVEKIRFGESFDPTDTWTGEFARRKLEFEIGGQIVDCIVYDCEGDALVARFAVLGDSIY